MLTFEDLIHRCNDFLWVHQYPSGQLAFASQQHRDLVRTFFAGALEALMATDQREAAIRMVPEYERMTRPDWLPDERFRRAHNPTGGA